MTGAKSQGQGTASRYKLLQLVTLVKGYSATISLLFISVVNFSNGESP